VGGEADNLSGIGEGLGKNDLWFEAEIGGQKSEVGDQRGRARERGEARMED
jgi:hypothetical protein